MSGVSVMLVAALLVAAACSDDAEDPGGRATDATSAVVQSSDPGPSTTDVSSTVPSTASVPTTTGVRAEGFDTATVEIRRGDGTTCVLCTYAARTSDQHTRGLMDVTDLAGHDGMIFAFDEPSPHSFWMKNTVMPLTGVWFGSDGAFVAAVDMDPCPPDADRCPTYGPPDDVLHVLEIPQGDLGRLGIGRGSVLLSVGLPCDPDGQVRTG